MSLRIEGIVSKEANKTRRMQMILASKAAPFRHSCMLPALDAPEWHGAGTCFGGARSVRLTAMKCSV